MNLRDPKSKSYILLVFFILSLFILIIYPVIDVDSAKYASISMEMLQNGSYFEIFDRFEDYLDKPPMLFWVSSFFLMIFGLKCWAYKLGSYIFLIAASAYFRLFIKGEHNSTIANNWMVLWCSSIGFSYLILDVKTEPLLLSGLLIAYPSLVKFIQQANYHNTVISSIGIAIGLMSKGPVTIVVLGALLIPYFVNHLNSQIHKFWFILIVLVLFLLSPMLFGLYQQFDLHPEKIVNSKTQVSGLRFYFWEQSFGRITGENQWKNQHDPFFLIHSLLLFSLPFTHYAIAGIYNVFRKKNNKTLLSISMIFGTVIPIILLSTSHYQLPHYSFVSLPWLIYFAVLPIEDVRVIKCLTYINYILLFLLNGMSIALIYFIFYDVSVINNLIMLSTTIIGISLIFVSKNTFQKLATTSLMLIIVLALSVGSLFSQFQPGNNINDLVERNNINSATDLFFYNRVSDSVEFHLGHRIPVVCYEDICNYSESNHSHWYYMASDALKMFQAQKRNIVKIDSLYLYDINRINLKFLFRNQRRDLLETRYLVKLDFDESKY